MRLMQGGSGGGSVFWEVISDCEKNMYMNMYIILNGCRGRAVGIYKYQNIASGHKERNSLLLIYFHFHLMFE